MFAAPKERRTVGEDGLSKAPPVEPVAFLGRLWCGICQLLPSVKGGRCTTCRRYLYRTGHERPAEIIDYRYERNPGKYEKKALTSGNAGKVVLL